jgi:hypothetical protein
MDSPLLFPYLSMCNTIMSPQKRIEVMATIKAAAVQMSPVLYSREGTLDRVIRKIIELGS